MQAQRNVKHYLINKHEANMMKRCEEKLSTNYVMIQQFAEPASAAITWK